MIQHAHVEQGNTIEWDESWQRLNGAHEKLCGDTGFCQGEDRLSYNYEQLQRARLNRIKLIASGASEAQIERADYEVDVAEACVAETTVEMERCGTTEPVIHCDSSGYEEPSWGFGDMDRWNVVALELAIQSILMRMPLYSRKRHEKHTVGFEKTPPPSQPHHGPVDRPTSPYGVPAARARHRSVDSGFRSSLQHTGAFDPAVYRWCRQPRTVHRRGEKQYIRAQQRTDSRVAWGGGRVTQTIRGTSGPFGFPRPNHVVVTEVEVPPKRCLEERLQWLEIALREAQYSSRLQQEKDSGKPRDYYKIRYWKEEVDNCDRTLLDTRSKLANIDVDCEGSKLEEKTEGPSMKLRFERPTSHQHIAWPDKVDVPKMGAAACYVVM
ncbi:hypothetical protein BC938DRAFT_483084 [Jimgerdemannia flammicorona]|uniref:Uncharacterized protein n=1 Tax=Jimgerdemannia flammicorona TaxID=994334 RepID=A0A433QCU8_9FUNG|nr:hypothetical protein BC938DRAFT_483084 [Jimgerdemannia flammicorona]